ncbi:protein of unknown function [Legionella fallonii LLAP-10]|uniref:Tn3 transposase DDE domain-containing protein n=1 Tax=Legionella fallonii LLAP-10 TaxID=1212491 RepID=A0A098G354_9GAMM|nr:protein of unknown function [Legionella fallonii LLAP-10]
MLHVVANVINVINKLTEDLEVTENMRNGLSPYHGGHINRYGVFPLSMDRDKLRVEYKLN